MRRLAIIKVRAEKTKSNRDKIWFFVKINKVDKLTTRMTEKREDTNQ